jgi:hypothetical protein
MSLPGGRAGTRDSPVPARLYVPGRPSVVSSAGARTRKSPMQPTHVVTPGGGEGGIRALTASAQFWTDCPADKTWAVKSQLQRKGTTVGMAILQHDDRGNYTIQNLHFFVIIIIHVILLKLKCHIHPFILPVNMFITV